MNYYTRCFGEKRKIRFFKRRFRILFSRKLISDKELISAKKTYGNPSIKQYLKINLLLL